MNTSRRPAPAAFAALAALLVAACSGSAGADVPRPSDLDGRSFVATGVTGREIVPGSTIRLGFQDSNVSGTAGCNSFGGAYRIESGRLIATEMFMTEMACNEPLMAQEGWVVELLRDAAIALDGDTLTLSSESVTLTLRDVEVAMPDRPLTGTEWTLDTLIEREAASSVPAGVSATLRIDGGTAFVNLGCNSGSASVTVDGDSVVFGPLGTTKMACPDDRMTVERAVAAVLVGDVPYAIDGDRLTLGDGARGLGFRAGGPTPSPMPSGEPVVTPDPGSTTPPEPSTPTGTVGEGKISGFALAGPTCPVVTEPPAPACAARPVEGAVVVVTDLTGAEVVRTTTGAAGDFVVIVPEGKYLVIGEPVEGLMGAPKEPVTVLVVAGEAAEVTLSYDTGIR